MVDLIIVNLYGGIIPVEGEPILREGFDSFLDRYKSKNIVVTAYKPEEIVDSDVKSLGLADKVDRIYTIENMPYFQLEEINLPDIRSWARVDFKSHETKAMCVSCDPRDLEGASWNQAQAIQIPVFKNKDDDFSFDAVSVGSLVTKTRYFFQRLNGKPQRIILE